MVGPSQPEKQHGDILSALLIGCSVRGYRENSYCSVPVKTVI